MKLTELGSGWGNVPESLQFILSERQATITIW